MYYRLVEKYELRGWQHLSCAVFNRENYSVKPVEHNMFRMLLLCDGRNDIDIKQLDSTEQDILQKLMQENVITQSEKENPILQDQEYRIYENRYFKSAFWSITGRCNFRCRHCYIDAPGTHLGELPYDEMTDIVDQLYDCGIRTITMTGGEPFVRSDFWKLTDYILSKGMLIEKIYTNGWLLDERCFENLNKRNMHPAFSISFDGVGWHDWMRGIPGAEDRTIRALKECVKRKYPVDVEMCLHRGNKDTIRETVNLLASIGVPNMKIGLTQNTPLWINHAEGNEMDRKTYYDTALEYIPYFYEDHMPTNVQIGGAINLNLKSTQYAILAEKSKGDPETCCNNYLCGAARFNAYITPEGRFLPCMVMATVDEYVKEFPLIRDIGVRNCMSDSYYTQFVTNRVGNLFERNSKCNACDYRYKCAGGCRAIAMSENNGDLYACDPENCFLYENGYPEKFRKAADEAIEKYCMDSSMA